MVATDVRGILQCRVPRGTVSLNAYYYVNRAGRSDGIDAKATEKENIASFGPLCAKFVLGALYVLAEFGRPLTLGEIKDTKLPGKKNQTILIGISQKHTRTRRPSGDGTERRRGVASLDFGMALYLTMNTIFGVWGFR